MSFTRFELFWLGSIALIGALILGRMIAALRCPRWNATAAEIIENRGWFFLTLILWIGFVVELTVALLKQGVGSHV
jgi:hypothetical protein